jgi:hypothetical protein
MTDDTIDEGKLRDLMNQVAALPKSIKPPPDAWAKIRSEIEAGGKPDRSNDIGSRSKRPARIAIWQRPVFLAAAALGLVAGSSAVTAIAISRRGNGGVPTTAGAAQVHVATTVADSGPASLAQFTLVEGDYLRAVNDLSTTLESEQGSLSPETIAKLHESIKVIDAAILEARNALAADPANRTLIQMLANSYEQKVDLLKRTTEMARS